MLAMKACEAPGWHAADARMWPHSAAGPGVSHVSAFRTTGTKQTQRATLIPMTEDDHGAEFDRLTKAYAAVKEEMDALILRVAAARRTYARSRNDADLAAMKEIEAIGQELQARIGKIGDELQAAAGITDEDIAAFERDERPGDRVDRTPRSQLTVDKIEPTEDIGDVLEASFDKLLGIVGSRVLAGYKELRLPRLALRDSDIPLSLVRGVRPESEFAGIHRFAQSILVTHDFLAQEPRFDHFAGALLVPQIAKLADRLDLLREVPGAAKRLRSLWRRSSDDVDSTIFELLVAAGCKQMGRDVEFLDPRVGKTPDLMCADPYPLAIECKRKRPLSDYEIQEERLMRLLYQRLELEARRSGMWGRFELQLRVEASSAPFDDIVAKFMLQRFAGGEGASFEYDWGNVAYVELPARFELPGQTRIYSPSMLQATWDWNTDLAGFDGLICKVSNDREPFVDRADSAVALVWSNLSEQAIKKRSWGPMSVTTEALQQIPPGDFGIVYIAYQEGARQQMADGRMDAFAAWLKNTSHRDDIRVPVCKLVRLYPRALGNGLPDLIESTVNLVADYSDAVLPTIFPSRVFT